MKGSNTMNEEKLDKLCDIAIIRQSLKEVAGIYGDLIEDYRAIYPEDTTDYMSSIKKFYDKIESILHESVENFNTNIK